MGNITIVKDSKGHIISASRFLQILQNAEIELARLSLRDKHTIEELFENNPDPYAKESFFTILEGKYQTSIPKNLATIGDIIDYLKLQ